MVSGSGREHRHVGCAPRGGLSPEGRAAEFGGWAVGCYRSANLFGCGAGEQNWVGAVGQQFAHNARDLIGGFAGPVDGLGNSLAQRSVVIDQCVANIGKGQAAQGGHCFVGAERSGAHAFE